MTTEEFIQRAREIHGDKYDYSKVEYINLSTKVCIICPEHGVFWQRPDVHLRGSGCSRCAGFRGPRKPNGYWNYKTCYEKARQCKTRKEFQRASFAAYNKAKVNGWLDDYTWFVNGIKNRPKQTSKWTYEACMEEAKKYKKIGDFSKGSNTAYKVAKSNGWLKEYHWLPRLIRPKGYWDIFENVERESKKYKTKSGFHKGCQYACNSARKHKWLDILFPNYKKHIV